MQCLSVNGKDKEDENDYNVQSFHQCKWQQSKCFSSFRRLFDDATLFIYCLHLNEEGILQQKFGNYFKDSTDKMIDVQWMNSILKKYLKSVCCFVRKKEKDFSTVNHLTVKIWDNNSMIHFIPDVIATHMHILPKSAEKCLIIACVKGLSCIDGRFFHQQFSFRLRYSCWCPFVVTLQVIGDLVDDMEHVVLINDHRVHLTVMNENEQILECFMGDDQFHKRYSYLPAFKNLFLKEDGSPLPFVDIQFEFEWKDELKQDFDRK